MRMVDLVVLVSALTATSLAAQSPSQARKQQAPAAEKAPSSTPAKPGAAPAPAASPKPATPAAQPAAPAPTATAGEAKTAAPAAPQAPGAPPPEAYTYRPEGRRDPFQTLVGNGTRAAATSLKGEGPAGLAVGDVSVRGIMQSRGALVAMVQGPDNKTYIVHQGDKFLDGTLKSITPQTLVIVQDVNDPLSLVKHREVRKVLRSLEDAKQ